MRSSSVYIAPIVQAIRDLHAETLNQKELSIREQLSRFARTLFEAYHRKLPAAATEINNHHPAYLGWEAAQLWAAKLGKEDMQWAIAREYGFQSWSEVEKLGDKKADPAFESAVDALLAGDQASITHLLETHPHLSTARSSYGHKAGLIHYIGSNGVEIHRQVVPLNLPLMAQTLLSHGVDRHMQAQFYGNMMEVKPLIETSAHPWDAGIGAELLQVLSS